MVTVNCQNTGSSGILCQHCTIGGLDGLFGFGLYISTSLDYFDQSMVGLGLESEEATICLGHKGLSEKENGKDYSILGYILGICWDNGKENGNCYNILGL